MTRLALALMTGLARFTRLALALMSVFARFAGFALARVILMSHFHSLENKILLFIKCELINRLPFHHKFVHFCLHFLHFGVHLGFLFCCHFRLVLLAVLIALAALVCLAVLIRLAVLVSLAFLSGLSRLTRFARFTGFALFRMIEHVFGFGYKSGLLGFVKIGPIVELAFQCFHWAFRLLSLKAVLLCVLSFLFRSVVA